MRSAIHPAHRIAPLGGGCASPFPDVTEFAIPLAVLTDERLSSTSKLLYALLARFSAPSYADLCAILKKSKNTIGRALASLVASGYVLVLSRLGGSGTNRYLCLKTPLEVAAGLRSTVNRLTKPTAPPPGPDNLETNEDYFRLRVWWRTGREATPDELAAWRASVRP